MEFENRYFLCPNYVLDELRIIFKPEFNNVIHCELELLEFEFKMGRVGQISYVCSWIEW